jgi:crossover junction endodeoxyribonuclease RuvC
LIILGIDPGTLFTGYAVIKSLNGRPHVLSLDVIKVKPENSLPLRLKYIYDGLSKVISRYKPDGIAIETAFYNKNVQSTLKLGHARGVSILAAVNKKIPTVEYSPREVKKSVAGNGNASKEQVKFMVCRLLNISVKKRLYDVFDAAAVALCHHNRLSGKDVRFAKTWKEYVQNNPSKIVNH